MTFPINPRILFLEEAEGEFSMPDIFISYSGKDTAIAEAIRFHLENSGLRCFTESWPIADAIRSCGVFLLILTDNAQNSPSVRKELHFAVSNNKPVLPYMPRSLTMSTEFRFLLHNCAWFCGWRYPDGGLEALTAQLRAFLPGEGGTGDS